MPKVSVIVPVYNVEIYLEKCLDSILAQTLEDIEIICVDDGSTDKSGSILDKYANQNSCVKVLHRENAGYGAAMNAGMDVAVGEYVGIVESDDCIRPEMYQILYERATENKLDLVKSDAFYWIERAEYLRKIHYQWLDDYYDRVLDDRDRNVFFDFYMNIWTGIYKRDFLVKNKIRFHESSGASYQDNGFWLQTLMYCQKAEWISQAFYLYRQDNPAASVKSQSKIMAMVNEYEFLARLLFDRKQYHLLPYCYYYRMYRHRGTFLRIADVYKREYCEQIKKDYAAYKGYIKGDRYLEKFYCEIVLKTDETCNEIVKKRRGIISRIEQAEQVIIYGTGRRGDIVFRGLFNEGYYDKICCFAVSQPPAVSEILAGKEVLSIHKAYDLYSDALIIVAVVRGSGMYYQMVETLENMGVTDYMSGSDIEENFYIA